MKLKLTYVYLINKMLVVFRFICKHSTLMQAFKDAQVIAPWTGLVITLCSLQFAQFTAPATNLFHRIHLNMPNKNPVPYS